MDELVDIFVSGMVKLADRAVPDDLALINHGDFVGDFAGAGQIMGNRQGGGAQLFHAFDDQIIDNVSHDRIEAGRGFVKEDNFRMAGDGAGQRNALLHPARELGREQMSDRFIQPDGLQFLDRDIICRAAVGATALNQAKGDIFPDPHRIEQGAALKQHAEFFHQLVAVILRHADGFLAVDQDRSFIRFDQSQHAFQHDGFARARTADNHQRFSGTDGKVNALQHLFGAERFFDAFEFKLRCHITHEKKTCVRI